MQAGRVTQPGEADRRPAVLENWTVQERCLNSQQTPGMPGQSWHKTNISNEPRLARIWVILFFKRANQNSDEEK